MYLLDGSLGHIDLDECMVNLLDKFKVQLDVEIKTKVLDLNDLRVMKSMFHWALVKCIKPKVHSQTTFMRAEN